MSEKDFIKNLIDYGNDLRGAEVYFRDDWECYYFSLLGKCFGMLNDEIITLKGIPNENVILREKYKSVIPGYYTNKKHWNSIILNDREFDEIQIKDFIFQSYELVYKGLTKKEKEIINEFPE